MVEFPGGNKNKQEIKISQIIKQCHFVAVDKPVSSFMFSVLVRPALGHLHGLLPPGKALVGLLLGHLGLEDRASLGVDILEVIEALPDAGSHAGGDGCAKCGCLTHGGAVDVDSDEIGLSLKM